MLTRRLLTSLCVLLLRACGDVSGAPGADTEASAGNTSADTVPPAQASASEQTSPIPDSRPRPSAATSASSPTHASSTGSTRATTSNPSTTFPRPESTSCGTAADCGDTAPFPADSSTEPSPSPACPDPLPATNWLPVDAGHGASWEGPLDACTSLGLAWVAAHSMRWEIRIEGLPNTDRAQAYTAHRNASPDTPVLATSTLDGDTQHLEVQTITSGEQLLTFERADPLQTSELRITWHCLDGCDRLATRFPIVLVHGYAGVDTYFGLLDYFYAVASPNRSRGYAIYAPTTSPVATSQRRAEQLAAQVDDILAETGARKLNFIAHSQGGLDVRVLISGMKYDHRAASLTTIATPHHGIPLRLAEFLSVQDFSPDYMEVFNLAYPDAEGVRYWSWSFRTCRVEQLVCRSNSDWERVNTLLVASHLLLSRFGHSDGIVPTESMVWGEHLGLHFADHFGQIGQIARPTFVGPFRHRDFYRDEFARLAAEGL